MLSYRKTPTAHPNAPRDMTEAIRQGDLEGFRRALRRRIGSKGLTQLSRKTGIPVRTLYRIRNGEGGARFDNVLRLLRVLGSERES